MISCLVLHLLPEDVNSYLNCCSIMWFSSTLIWPWLIHMVQLRSGRLPKNRSITPRQDFPPKKDRLKIKIILWDRLGRMCATWECPTWILTRHLQHTSQHLSNSLNLDMLLTSYIIMKRRQHTSSVELLTTRPSLSISAALTISTCVDNGESRT